MYKEEIKDWLLTNKSQVYSLIVREYYSKIEELKPSLFRLWLSKELGIPEEKINLSSLHSAIARLKKSGKIPLPKGKKDLSDIPSANNNFNFSAPEDVPPNKRITEL